MSRRHKQTKRCRPPPRNRKRYRSHGNTWSQREFLVTGLVSIVLVGLWGWVQFRGSRRARVRMSTMDEILCPVGGMPIDRDVSVETPDGTVYFCCQGCIQRFRSDLPEYEKASAAQREAFAALDRVETAVHANATTRKKE